MNMLNLNKLNMRILHIVQMNKKCSTECTNFVHFVHVQIPDSQGIGFSNVQKCSGQKPPKNRPRGP